VNPADYQYNGSVTSKVYIDGTEVGSTSDLVAAFVNDEVRGVINGLSLPPFLGGGFSFNIMIFSNEAGGETVSFQYYDSANDAVIELDETLEFTSDMVVGDAIAPFVLNGVGDTGGDDGGNVSDCDSDHNTWSVNPASFQYNGSVTSKVFLNDDEVGAEDDMLAAFVGDELRGVINGLALPPFLGGGYSFNIMIYSNEAAGETVDFKFYQASSNTVVCLNETVDFVSDMVIGNATNPFIFTGNIIEGEDIFGCTDGSACNFNASATVDDGSCSFAEDNYDCDGNCIAGLDCAGECGGSAETDECGICGGSGIPDGYCDCNGNIADCAGDCGGSVSFDDCGVCAGDNSTCDPVIDFSISGGSNGNIDIHFSISTPISGFQFDVDGMTFSSAMAASGGSADENGFMVSTSNGGSMVLGFSLTGSEIPIGDGLLTSLTGTFNDVTACLSNIIVSQNATGFLVLTGEGECVETDAVLGCTDSSACNYDAASSVDDGSCSFAEENFDCDGNCLGETDCAGQCAGSTVVDCNGECGGGASIDECGVCDGLGAIYECGCDDFPDGGSPDPGTIPENTLTILEEDGIVNIYMHNTTPVGGFQFTVNGASATGSSGGSAEAQGFMVSASGTTVIGFSLSGATIPNGSALLTSLTGSVVGELSMSNLIISDSIGGALVYDYFDLSADGGEVCDCDGNILDECGICDGDSTSCEDCNGLPNGSAQLDNCGTCDDDASNDCVEDCNGVWGGFAEIDECGVCGGDGIVEGTCDCDGTLPAENEDCDGNCLVDIDCAGLCGGFAYEITLCEDTDGDGYGNPGTEVIECVEGGRDSTTE
jgi:hypothetical protein